jgi:hypothetical protein
MKNVACLWIVIHPVSIITFNLESKAMATLIGTFVLLLLVVAGMAIGVMFGRKPLKGSCGGLNNGSGESSCTVCGGNPAKCDESAQ